MKRTGMMVAAQHLRILAVLLFVYGTLCQQCKVTYGIEGKPLLFGGVSSSCTGGCESRTADDWGEICSFNPNSTVWGVCTEEQAMNSFELAKTLGQGETLRLSPCELIKYLRGRTLWLLGDSHSKVFYRALQCFLFDFWDHSECQASTEPQDMADLLHLPAADGINNCFHLLGPGGGRVCMVHVVLATSLVNNTEVAEGGLLPLLRARFAAPQDIFHISVGSWHRKTPEWGAAYGPALDALGAYYEATKAQWPHLLFRETPAIHTMDAARNVCMPLDGYQYDAESGALLVADSAENATLQWLNGLGLNKAAKEVLSRYKIPLIPAFNITAPLADNHIGMRLVPSLDCLHYCQPGAPEIWIWYLYRAFQRGRTGIRILPAAFAETPAANATSDADTEPQSTAGHSHSQRQPQKPNPTYPATNQASATQAATRIPAGTSSSPVAANPAAALQSKRRQLLAGSNAKQDGTAEAVNATQGSSNPTQGSTEQQQLPPGHYVCVPSTIRFR